VLLEPGGKAMLEIVALVIGGILTLVVAFVLWRIVATIAASQRRTDRILAEIAPVTEALQGGREPSNEHIQRFAAEPSTRNMLLEALREHRREELFPREYATAEAMAESDLCFWLCHPNELQQPPDEIECMGRFTRTLQPSALSGSYYLFRFRVKPPHWAADDGWMAGVAGPHVEGQEPEPAAPGTFSTFYAYDSKTPDAHVDEVHAIMVARAVYADLADGTTTAANG
jgi:hypothetical protein